MSKNYNFTIDKDTSRFLDKNVQNELEKQLSEGGKPSPNLTFEEMENIARILRDYIIRLLPDELTKGSEQPLTRSSLVVGDVQYDRGSRQFYVDLFWTGMSIRRESYEYVGKDPSMKAKYGGHTGEGIDNIVSLYNNGFSASRTVGLYRKIGMVIPNRQYLDAGKFMQQAVDDFNVTEGAAYNCTAILGSDYNPKPFYLEGQMSLF